MQETDFDAVLDQALGTFLLTGCMFHHFERIVIKGMGLRSYQHLRQIYFAHHKLVLYIVQTDKLFLLKKLDKRRQHCNWTITITILCMAMIQQFWTICTVAVSHLSPLVKHMAIGMV
tara:strand:+ start:1281 stop:1631 length:351 start_codon:yes stop_codon:yes gene_type:complete